MFETEKWREPFHPYRVHPRRDLVVRYLEIVLSILALVFGFPYDFRVSPNLVASSKYHSRPDAVKNAYFVFSILFGFFLTGLTAIICAVYIWILHFRPAWPPSTSSSGYPRLRWHRSRTNQDAGLIFFWFLALVWWNVARLLKVGDQFPPVSDLVQIIISIVAVLQILLLIVSLRIGMADARKAGENPSG